MIKKIIILCTALLLASPVNAFAHGEITQATPAADSTVIAAPTVVSLEFDGKLQTLGNATVNSITVTDDQGQVISDPVSVVEGTKISNRLQLTDVTGLVSVHYRVVSEDGHPVEGDYSFTVGQTPTITSAGSEETAEEANGISEESGSNLLLNGLGGLILLGALAVIVRRFKK
ncbi:MAG: copper resistance CopC family protein [Actinomycetes bacterium]